MDNQIAFDLLNQGVLDIREPDEEPFTYSSGNKGPGYVMVKGLVSKRYLLKSLISQLAQKVISNRDIDFVAGNATGGMIPGWLMAEALDVPFVYVRNTRKEGGQREHITGLNPLLPPTASALVVEELVNFAQTTCNSAKVLREAGFTVKYAATILNYNHKSSQELLRTTGIELVSLVTLSQLLAAAEQEHRFSINAISNYRKFLIDPQGYQDALRSDR